MKKMYFLILALIAFTAPGNASVNETEAVNFIKSLTKEGIESLVNSTAPEKEKLEKFRDLFEKNLDLDFVGKFVLGKYYRTATPAQRKEFLHVYRESNISTWSKRFDEFKGRHFEFKGTTSSKSKNQIFVNTIVPMGNGLEPIDVVWRVVQEDDGDYKVIDIIIENVSLAISARNEYAAFIKNHNGNIDALIDKLKG